MTLSAGLPRDLESAHAWHLDVEEQNFGRVRLECVQRLDAILGFGTDGELRPELREHFLQLAAQHRLVFGDHCFPLSHRGSPYPGASRAPLASALASTVSYGISNTASVDDRSR